MKISQSFSNFINTGRFSGTSQEAKAVMDEARSVILDVTRRIESGEIAVPTGPTARATPSKKGAMVVSPNSKLFNPPPKPAAVKPTPAPSPKPAPVAAAKTPAPTGFFHSGSGTYTEAPAAKAQPPAKKSKPSAPPVDAAKYPHLANFNGLKGAMASVYFRKHQAEITSQQSCYAKEVAASAKR